MRVVFVGVIAAGTAASAAPPAYHAHVAADDPVLWYRFGEEAGTTAKNFGSLGAAFDGTYVNGVSLGAPTIGGDDGACFSAAHVQHVEAMSPAPDFLLGNPSFTAEVVVRMFEAQPILDYGPYLHWGVAGTGNSVFFSQSWQYPDRAFAGFFNAGLRMVGTYELDEWVHIVWVRDSGGGVNDTLTGSTLYVNGEEVALEPDPVLCCNEIVPNVQQGPIRVQRGGSLTRYFNGDIDEVALYDHLLTAEDVQAHYQSLVENAGCTADCDGNGVLNILDFVCFQSQFVSGDLRADCDRNDCMTLDILDFVCFQQEFLAGCP